MYADNKKPGKILPGFLLFSKYLLQKFLYFLNNFSKFLFVKSG